MKQLLFIATFIMSLNSALAHEVAPAPIYGASFSKFDIQHDSLQDTVAGSIRIDLVTEEIEISLTPRTQCPDGLACIALAPAPIVIKLPIVDIYDDWCGSTTYVAEVDNTPVDGFYESIEVRDYANLTCRILVPFKTVAQYKTLNPWTGETTVSTFHGNPLRLLPQFH